MLSELEYPSILQAARTGADWAWTALYREVSPMLLRYLKAHGALEPEDTLGEVFVQVVRKFPAFAGDGADFRAWVFTITRNRLIDEWRRVRRNPVDLASGEALPASVSCVRDVEEDLMSRVADDRVREIIGRLTRDQRDVLFLRIFAGLTVEEVAVVVGKRPGAVKSLQTRAFAAVRREIAKEAVTL